MPEARKPSLTGLQLLRAIGRLSRIYWGSADTKRGAGLRALVSYPGPEGKFADERIVAALKRVGLERLETRLADVDTWEQQLSDHERQRLAIARVLLNEPTWIFMDRATSALEETSEVRMYELLATRLPGSAVISVAHRPSVERYHDRHWRLSRQAEGPALLQIA